MAMEKVIVKNARLLWFSELASHFGDRMKRRREYRWWLMDCGADNFHTMYVDTHGRADKFGYYVDMSDFEIRPALEIEGGKPGDIFEFGGQKFRVIAYGLAFCEGMIGMGPYNTPWRDGNSYKRSTIKDVIETWFSKAVEENGKEIDICHR